MPVDTVKAIATYLIALVIVLGGFAILFATRNEAVTDTRLIIAGFMGSAVTFVFSSETQTRTARQAAAATYAATLTNGSGAANERAAAGGLPEGHVPGQPLT
jgi:hypothetical protein